MLPLLCNMSPRSALYGEGGEEAAGTALSARRLHVRPRSLGQCWLERYSRYGEDDAVATRFLSEDFLCEYC